MSNMGTFQYSRKTRFIYQKRLYRVKKRVYPWSVFPRTNAVFLKTPHPPYFFRTNAFEVNLGVGKGVFGRNALLAGRMCTKNQRDDRREEGPGPARPPRSPAPLSLPSLCSEGLIYPCLFIYRCLWIDN
jgi:hypothetical protein